MITFFLKYLIRGTFLVTVLFFCLNHSDASSLTTRTEDPGGVYVAADDVPVIDIIKEITQKTGIILTSAADLNQTISIDIEDETLEKCLKLILGENSHVLIFKKTSGGKFVPIELKIYPAGENLGVGQEVDSSTIPSQVDSIDSSHPNIKVYSRDAIEKDFSDSSFLASQLRAEKAVYGEGTEDSGLRISGIAEDSVFKRIGLEEGDIVRDVNGRRVETPKELIEAIQAVMSENLPTIRIARMKHTGNHLPIYIHIN